MQSGMNIKIEAVEDGSDCETCGGNYAEGFHVTIDGKVFGDYTPRAHCYDSEEYRIEEVLLDIIEGLGHTVELDGFDIQRHKDNGDDNAGY